MKKFRVEFKHTVEESYVAYVEAENEKEAKELVNENPFDFVSEEDEEPFDVQDISSEIVDITQVE